MEGFIRRVWRNQGVDKVVMVKKGVFMVRLRSMEKRDHYQNGNHIFFDNKPVIVKPWKPSIDMVKEDVGTLPTGVHLHLDFNIREKDVLIKLLASLGKW